MKTAKTILLCAAVAAMAGCATDRSEETPPLFPEPFGNIRLGMSEGDFGKLRPEAVFDFESDDAQWSWWDAVVKFC